MIAIQWRLIAGVLGGLLVARTSAVQAQATTIDFESLGCTYGGTRETSANSIQSPLNIDGYSFVGSGAGSVFAVPCAGNPFFYAGSAAVIPNVFGMITTLSRIGGATFGLRSIALGYVFGPGSTPTPKPVTFAGLLNNSTQVFQSFLLPVGNSPFLTTFTFRPEFRNVRSVTWEQVGPTNNQATSLFDDVTVDPAGAVVPEPQTLVLLATGLVAIWAIGRWRRKHVATAGVSGTGCDQGDIAPISYLGPGSNERPSNL